MMSNQWREKYDQDDPEKERITFEALARDIMRVQVKIRKRNFTGGIQRTFHAKSILAVKGANCGLLIDCLPICVSDLPSPESPTP